MEHSRAGGSPEHEIEFDGRAVTFGFGELDEIVLAYATTIHKSQGSEYRIHPAKAAGC